MYYSLEALALGSSPNLPGLSLAQANLVEDKAPIEGVDYWALLFAPFSGSFYVACLPSSWVTFLASFLGREMKTICSPFFATLTHHELGNFAVLLVGTRSTGSSAFVLLSTWYFGLCTAKDYHSHSPEPSCVLEFSGHSAICLRQS